MPAHRSPSSVCVHVVIVVVAVVVVPPDVTIKRLNAVVGLGARLPRLEHVTRARGRPERHPPPAKLVETLSF